MARSIDADFFPNQRENKTIELPEQVSSTPHSVLETIRDNIHFNNLAQWKLV
jgi:hypothetical protein